MHFANIRPVEMTRLSRRYQMLAQPQRRATRTMGSGALCCLLVALNVVVKEKLRVTRYTRL